MVDEDAALLTLEDFGPEAGHEFVAEAAEVEALGLTILPLVLAGNELSALQDAFDGDLVVRLRPQYEKSSEGGD